MLKCQSQRDVSGFVLVVLVFTALTLMTFAGSMMPQSKNTSEKSVSSDVSVISSSQMW